MSRVLFAFDCPQCPGDGVRRGKRPGVDWPTPCPCKARRELTQYQIARIIKEQPKTILRVNEMRSTVPVAARVLHKLIDRLLWQPRFAP